MCIFLCKEIFFLHIELHSSHKYEANSIPTVGSRDR